ncbi:MAG: DUF2860 family protein [Gammaproteobacteria bacterium]|nr:DUF2860 family protein [Gammaproteobacteria bacterium]
MKHRLSLLAALLFVGQAWALNPLGDKTGFSGFVNLGVGGGQVESNFFAKIADTGVDLGNDTIYNLGSPESKDLVMPAVAMELGYTFSNKKTRIFLGNDFSDYLQFDRSTRFAIRHDFGRLGTLQLAYLRAAALATEVWSDPYLVGAKRDSTDMEVSGARLTWDRMFGTAFELKVSATERDIDNEQSGMSQPLTPEERQLLDRNGDAYRVELGYMMKLDGGHLLRPSLSYVDEDRDGRAMAQEGYAAEVTYIYRTKNNTRWVTTASYGKFDGDAVNPLFNKKNDADRYFLASTLFVPGLFGLDKWVTNIGVVWGSQDSDITFNETNMWLINAGLLRRF